MSKLQYQPLNIKHAEDLLVIWADAEVIKYTNMQLPCTIDDVKKRIAIFTPWQVFAIIEEGIL